MARPGNQPPCFARFATGSGAGAGLLGWGLVASIASLTSAQEVSAPPVAASDVGAPVVLEAFEVTGSRIKRVDTETVSPVVDLEATDLAALGYPTLGAVLRTLPFNTGQALTTTDSASTFTPGISTVNFRGLGNNQTLVLVNGRRAVPLAAPGFEGLQTMFDFNSLPWAAVENIEILKDGGSAIYGSDAVAGVVNVKLRSDYHGTALTAEIGNAYDGGARRRQGSLTLGRVSARTRVLTILDWAEQDPVFAREVAHAAHADKTSVAHRAGARYTAENFADGGFASAADYLADLGYVDPVAEGAFDNRSTRGYPGRVYVAVGTDPDTGEPIFDDYTFAEPTANPTPADAIPGTNGYDFQKVGTVFAGYRTYGAHTSIRHDFSANLHGLVELGFHRHAAAAGGAPTAVDLEAEQGLTADEGMILPAIIPFAYAPGETPFAHPYNPFAQDIVTGRRRLVELPIRFDEVTADTTRVLAGVGGTLNRLEGWTWEAAVLFNRSSVASRTTNVVEDVKLQQALFGLTRQPDGTLAWNPSTPPAQRVHFNWFGPNDAALAPFLLTTLPATDGLTYWTYDARVAGPLLDLSAGPMSIAAGLEHRSEAMHHRQTERNAAGGIVGGYEGTSHHGRRRVSSLYSELKVPLPARLEVQLAARYEDYSDDGFSDSIRPKLGAKWKLSDSLLLRASYSQSFKAPDLSYLYAGSSTSFESVVTNDPVTGDAIDALQVVISGNPELDAETTDTWFAGAVWEAPARSGWRGLSASLEYFHLGQRQVLGRISQIDGFEAFLRGEAADDPRFVGKVVRDPQSNRVRYLRDDFTNIGTARYRGIDLGLHYTTGTENWGRLNLGFDATHVLDLIVNGRNLAGGWATPDWSGTAVLGWTRGPWSVHLCEVVKGATRNDVFWDGFYFGDDVVNVTYDVKAQWVTNLAVSYRGFRDLTVTVGATNLFDQTPPVDPFEGSGTTPGVYNAEAGHWYVRLTREF